jgi:hypothetical protein
MGRVISSLLTVGVVFGVLVAPQAALGSETLLPPVAGAVLTRYGVRYETPAGGATHRGLDLGADEGAAVSAAADGIVTFAGLVPADGGGRCTAVTITTPGGLLVTVSPLLEACVGKGAHVIAGDELGTLAGAGDASSPQPHVHLSVRISGTYIDPQPMLVAIESQPAPQPAPQPQQQAAVSPQPAPPPALQPVAQPGVAPAQPAADTRAPGVARTQITAAGSPAATTIGAQAATPAGALQLEVGTRPVGVTFKALERAQERLRAGAGITSGSGQAVQAAHIAPEMLRQKSAFDAPHLSGVRTASVGVLLAAAAGLALWSGLDRRGLASARSGVE